MLRVSRVFTQTARINRIGLANAAGFTHCNEGPATPYNVAMSSYSPATEECHRRRRGKNISGTARRLNDHTKKISRMLCMTQRRALGMSK